MIIRQRISALCVCDIILSCDDALRARCHIPLWCKTKNVHSMRMKCASMSLLFIILNEETSNDFEQEHQRMAWHCLFCHDTMMPMSMFNRLLLIFFESLTIASRINESSLCHNMMCRFIFVIAILRSKWRAVSLNNKLAYDLSTLMCVYSTHS